MYTLKEVLTDYPNDLSAFRALAVIAGLTLCPQCSNPLSFRIRKRSNRNYNEKEIKCDRRSCRRRFNFRTGTVLLYGKTDYDKLVLMLYLFQATDGKIEPVIAARYAGLDRKTGFRFIEWYVDSCK